MSPLSSMACIPCRSRKKKCDKEIPRCGRCTRIGINCRYDESLGHTGGGNSLGGGVLPSASINLEAMPSYSPWRFHDGYSSFALPTRWTDYIDTHLTTITLVTLTSRGHDIRSECLPYLETLNEWLPVILSSELDECISSILFCPDSESSILIYSCFLLSRICGNESDPEVEELYLKCKGFFTLLISQRRSSEKLVQVGLLLTLYEYLQAMIDVAMTTIASAAVLADHTGLFLERHGIDCGMELTRSKQIWWSLFILERVIIAAAIDNPAISKIFVCPAPPVPEFPIAKTQETEPFLSGSQSSTSQIPYTQYFLQNHESGSDGQLPYFTRLVQACYLLELALRDRWAHFNRVSSPGHCIDLDRQLTTFALAVLQEGNAGQGKNCTCLAICVNAMIILHGKATADIRHEGYHEERLTDTCPVLAVAIQMVLDRIKQFPDWHYRYAAIIPIWSHHCFYLGALSCLQQNAEQSNRLLNKDVVESVLHYLKVYSERWKLSGKIFALVKVSTYVFLTGMKLNFIIIFLGGLQL